MKVWRTKVQKKNVILADCDAEEVDSFAQGLSSGEQVFQTESHIANWKRTGPWSELKRYGMYFAVAWKAFAKRKAYGILVGWQQFYALIFCFYCSLFRVKKPCKVVAFNFTYKRKNGKFAGIYRWFMGKCLDQKYLDYIHVPSEQYADFVTVEFGFPRDRMLVIPFGVNDRYDVFSKLPVPDGYQKDGYALAIGRSNRDYDFLIQAWQNIEYPLVIISDTYTGTAAQQNITILRNVAGEASYPWIAHCGLMVIPIDDGTICSGDTVLLTAMSMERKILVTAPSTLAEMYITDGENAVLTEKNVETFQSAVKRMLFSGECAMLGKQARKSYLQQFTRNSMGVRLAERLQAR